MTDTPAQHLAAQKRYERTKKGVKTQEKSEQGPVQVKKRENRNKARAHMIKAGKVHKHDNKDVEHRDGNALNNSPSNWGVGSQHHNRSYARTKSGSKKNPRS